MTFSAETLQTRREWHNIAKIMKGKDLYSMWQGSHLDWMERSKVYRLAETKSSAPSNQFCKKCEKGFSKQNSKGHNKKYESYKRKNLFGKGKYTVTVANRPDTRLVERLRFNVVKSSLSAVL